MIKMENLENDIKAIINTAYPYIEQFNPAQKAVIESGYLDDESNYIISIPTASGKTILGILPALKTILNGGKAVYAAPLLSIQNEKVKEFKAFENMELKLENIHQVQICQLWFLNHLMFLPDFPGMP